MIKVKANSKKVVNGVKFIEVVEMLGKGVYRGLVIEKSTSKFAKCLGSRVEVNRMNHRAMIMLSDTTVAFEEVEIQEGYKGVEFC